MHTASSREKETLPDGWQWTRLGQVSRIVSGATPKTTIREYWDGSIVWVTPADLGKLEGDRILESERRITREGYDSCSAEMVPVGTVVVSSRAPIGHLGIAGVPLCTNQGCKSFVVGPLLDSQFLYFMLRSMMPQIRAIGSGATFAEVSKSQFERLPVAIPNVVEQRQIAAQLTEQTKLVMQARSAVEIQLAAMRQLRIAISRELFHDERVARSKRRALGEVCRLVNGDAFRAADWSQTGLPIIRIQNLNDPTKPYNYWAGPREDRVVVQEGDVLLAWSGTPGTSFGAHRWSGSTGVLNQHIFRVDLNDAVIDPDWAVIAINEQLDEMIGRAQGAVGLRHITKKDTLALQIAVPELPVQRELASAFRERADQSEKLRHELRTQLAMIDSLDSALLREAFPRAT